MAKKSFDISSTLNRNKDKKTQLAGKIPLKKTKKNLEEVQEKVELIHGEKETEVKKAKQSAPKASKKEPEKVKLVRLTIDTPATMHKKLKIRSIERGISMRDYILQLLEKELNRK